MGGSVYRRCTTCGASVKSRKHRDGCRGPRTVWAFIVDAGRDADGRRLRESRSGFATQREAAETFSRLVFGDASGA